MNTKVTRDSNTDHEVTIGYCVAWIFLAFIVLFVFGCSIGMGIALTQGMWSAF